MILNFSLGNFRSFHEIQTIDFRATGLVSEDKEVDNNNISVVADTPILKTVGVYGPNGSGKTNVIAALSFFKQMVASSVNSEGLISLFISPFVLSSNISLNNGYFQMTLLLENRKYRYGFTIKDKDSIAEEWLFGPAEKNETFYFKRKGAVIEYNKERFLEGDNLPLDKLRPDALFLTFVSAYHGEISKKIRGFIAGQIKFEFDIFFLSTESTGSRRVLNGKNYTNWLVETGKKATILEWLRNAGLNYQDISIAKQQQGNDSTINLFKNVYDSNGVVVGTIPMNLEVDESAGTKKLYSFIGPLYKLFSEGGTFVIDEIDSNFHPSLLLKLISFFNNPQLNKANAQLLFTSHDTNLLDPNVLRRDQIYFTEKSLQEATVLYSLADLKGIRNNADFARQYLAGLYGALPLLCDYVTTEKTPA